MGWDCCNKPADVSAHDFVLAEVKSWVDCQVLGSAMVGPVFYGAVRHDVSGQPDVFGLVILTEGSRDPRCNFCFKVMDETMGPYESRCPESVLRLLSPRVVGVNEYADDWRARCWAKLGKPDPQLTGELFPDNTGLSPV